jgi:hypothetical protein
MSFENAVPNLSDWLFGSGADLGAMVMTIVRLAIIALVGFLVSFLIASVRRGPVEGFYAVAKVVASGVVDISSWSLRRTIAMSILAVQEAIRRRVLIGFVVFVVVVLFAGWYLDAKSDHPARLYLSFVLTASNYLVVLMALFLSAFSLPADIKNRTIYTVVTKPVRALEIVLGRIIGFVAVGTLMLVPMGLVSYFFVLRGLSHEHVVEGEVTPVADGDGLEGETTYDGHHRHTFQVGDDGTGVTDVVMNHWHDVSRADDGSYEVGPPIGMLQARRPVYGKLRYKDRSGADSLTGLSVGQEWTYRSYIEGGSLAAAIWTFEGVTEERYPEGFDLELNLRVFRTFKGDIVSGILGTMVLRNPDPNASIQRSEAISFTAQEFTSDKHFIPSKLRVIDRETGRVDEGSLFDLVDDNGRLELWIQCSERAQYYGMAERDVYILDADGVFALNLAKGYVGIWLQMVIVTAFGVMFSTILSGAVAMMATLSSIVIGYFGKFIVDVAAGSMMGGGPIESLIRMATQKNVQVDLDLPQISISIIQFLDRVFMLGMRSMSGMLPNYSTFTTTQYVAYGYNIDSGLLSIQLLTAFCYVWVVSLIAYFLLKTREVAA